MAETIAKLIIKRTAEADAIPELDFIEHGELAINFADGKLFYLDDDNDVQVIGIKNPASLSSSQSFIGQNNFTAVNFTPVALNDGVISWDAEDGNVATVTLTQNSSLPDITNMSPGSYVLRVKQDGVGGRTLSFGPKFKSVSGTVYTISTGVNDISIITILNFGDDDLYLVGLNPLITFGS